MIGFLQPAMLALVVPVVWLLWRFPGPNRSNDLARGLLALVLIGALARPYLNLSDPGRHLVLLVDRSYSMPEASDKAAMETIRLLEEARAAGDHLGVLSFGGRAEIESLPSEELRLDALERDADPEATDLAEAIEAGLQQIPDGAQGSLLVFSDGLNNGRDPLAEARRVQARGLRLDVLPQERPPISDLAVERFELPPEVAVGEPFQFNVWLRADETQEREVVLLRGGRILSRGTRTVERGSSRLVFRDILPAGGVTEYEVVVAPPLGGAPDRVPENDRGLGAVRVSAAPTVLVLNEDGQPDTLSGVLAKAAIPHRVARPEDLRLDRVGLTPYRAIVLENVAAKRLGMDGMRAIEDFVTERGGGLLMTGGRASFGIGGYHLSPIDPVLPVSLEMRQEHRKMGVAIAMVLDRSGSMSAPVGGNLTKMDLANAGAASAIEMLSGMDSVAVIAVDSAAHIMVPLEPVDDPSGIVSRVRKIRSEGGGIFTYNGLAAAGQVLIDAPQQNKHIILFADAADAEQPEGVPQLLEDFADAGITVSVIALGTEQDADAEFLFETAERGGGDIYFTTDAEELPRLFSQDTLTVARSTFIEEPTATQGLPDLIAMGEFGVDPSGAVVPFPTIDAYNLNHLRPGATLGARTLDEYGAPFFAFWHRGVGRTATLAGQVGGSHGQALLEWPELPSMLVTTTRWLLGQDEPEDLFADLRVEGNEAVVRLEVDRSMDPDTSLLDLHLTRGDGERSVVPLAPVGADVFEARLPLGSAGVALGSVHLADGRVLQLPPAALPYSPEFAPIEAGAGRAQGGELLERMAQLTGGGNLANLEQAFAGPREARRWRQITWELLALALGLFLLEILTRRLSLLSAPWLRGLGALLVAPLRASARALGSLRRAAPVGGGAPADSPSTGPAATADRRTDPASTPPAAEPRRDKKPGPGSMQEALQRARKRADRRLDR